MNRLGERLQPLIDTEQRSPGPTPEAVADCWDRIAAAVQRGAFPPLDVPPPAPPRSPLLWLTVVLIGAGLVGATAYVASGSREPAPVATISAPTATTAPTATIAVPTPASAPPPLAPPPPAVVASVPEPPPPPEEPAEFVKPATAKLRPSHPAPAPAPAPAEADTFAAELRLLARGQAALNRDDHAGALEIADEYKKTYPKGHFIEDRDALRAVALCGAEPPKAAAAARRFLRAYPNSIHATRVRDACGLPADKP